MFNNSSLFLVGESDPLNGLGLVRRRRTSSIESSPSKPSKSDKPEKKSGDKKSEKSAKKPREHWKSEIITTNLKIRIRSPESDGGGVAVKQEDGPPVLTPQNTSPTGIIYSLPLVKNVYTGLTLVIMPFFILLIDKSMKVVFFLII